MSVVSIKEKWQGREGEVLPLSSSTLTRQWLITVDAKTDSAATIFAALGGSQLPTQGTTHPDNSWAVCRSLRIVNENDSWKFWIATATYSTEAENEDEEEDEPNPLDRATKVSIYTIQRQEYTTQGYRNGAKVTMQNSAGDAMSPWPIDVSSIGVSMTKNVSSRPSYIFTLRDTVNNATYTVDGLTFAAGDARVMKSAISPAKVENGVTFYEVTTDLEIRDTWDIERVDEGFHFLDQAQQDGNGEYISGSGVYSAITIPDPNDSSRRVRPSEPVLLDGAGGLLNVANVETPVILTWGYYKPADWSILPF